MPTPTYHYSSDEILEDFAIDKMHITNKCFSLILPENIWSLMSDIVSKLTHYIHENPIFVLVIKGKNNEKSRYGITNPVQAPVILTGKSSSFLSIFCPNQTVLFKKNLWTNLPLKSDIGFCPGKAKYFKMSPIKRSIFFSCDVFFY